MFRTEAECRTGHIDGDVSASDDHDAFADTGLWSLLPACFRNSTP